MSENIPIPPIQQLADILFLLWMVQKFQYSVVEPFGVRRSI
jgi:hypothetical protein